MSRSSQAFILTVLAVSPCSATILGTGLALTIAAIVVVAFLMTTWRIRQAEETAAKEARVAKETFAQTLTIVCHELRNPVHALQGTLNMLMEDSHGVLRPNLQTELLTAISSARTIEAVLDDVLEMQREDVVRCLTARTLLNFQLCPHLPMDGLFVVHFGSLDRRR